MKMNFNLGLEQTQKLVMTPELKQAIEILQYPSVELNKFIQEEMLNNPVLKSENQSDNYMDYVDTKDSKNLNDKNNFDKLDWNYMTDDYPKGTYIPHNSDDDVDYYNFIPCEETLVEYLNKQLYFSNLKGVDKDIALFLIEMVEDNGYIHLEISEVARKFNVDEFRVEKVLCVIQTFEPHGVCARDLKECLLIQLRNKQVKNVIVTKIVEKYLDDLARNKLSKIAKELNVNIEKVKEAIDIIKSLEPKPGRLFYPSRDVRYVSPDVFIEKRDGEYVVIVNDITAPRLKINKAYKQMLMEKDINIKTAEYINKKLVDALKLIKSIEQRRNTIYKVVNAILKFQYEFFEGGKKHLRILTLKEIADEIGMHESTVSRAVSGKYLQCPRGLYEIKYFFQSGVNNTVGDGVSSESIKLVIRELIDNENPKKPLSDQSVSDELNRRGIKISRRTVAKYRDELGILSTSKRKKY